jgi:hypothetical protein
MGFSQFVHTVSPDELRIETHIKGRRLGVVLVLQRHSFLFHGRRELGEESMDFLAMVVLKVDETRDTY